MIAYIAGNGKSRSDYASKKDGNQDRQQNDHAPCFRIPLFATIPGSPVLGSLSSLIFCAKEVSFAFIVVVVSDGSWESKTAMRPEICGQAMDVPEIVLMMLEPPIQVLVMVSPGA